MRQNGVYAVLAAAGRHGQGNGSFTAVLERGNAV